MRLFLLRRSCFPRHLLTEELSQKTTGECNDRPRFCRLMPAQLPATSAATSAQLSRTVWFSVPYTEIPCTCTWRDWTVHARSSQTLCAAYVVIHTRRIALVYVSRTNIANTTTANRRQWMMQAFWIMKQFRPERVCQLHYLSGSR